MQIAGRDVGNGPYVIAEIGGNHNGDFDTAMKMIRVAAQAGADAVKFQRRDVKSSYTKALYNAPYINENSLGPTYGAHREALECFDEAQWHMLKDQAHKYGVAFIVTAFDIPSAQFLDSLGIDAVKISSAGLTDTPLIERCGRIGKPMIISTGGGMVADVMRAYYLLFTGVGCKEVAFLHCISTYPNEDRQLNLKRITLFQRILPDCIVGFSSHHAGIQPLIIARALGAIMFEVHFTLNRGQRGTDHGFSMEPRGLEKLCEDLRRVEVMLGDGSFSPLPEEERGFVWKQGKAIHAARSIPAGAVVTTADVAIKAPADGIPPYLWHEVIGKIAVCDISTADHLSMEMLKET